ncbi:hypothetical protein [Thalassococcus sp. S3]|uniref:hypothetical protein n=1 Tax=Thalassococcus sp. S3 TaxID=2017482 RepID=UPI00102450FC|nr:hypothetical protein [Thalassococcus sp. S3]QBF32349.1 hypothetical protein CFI11_14160 [Thalassococcus sp. S3]
MSTAHPAVEAARASFSGRGLTQGQFDEAWAISEIIHKEIQRSGSFHEKLIDYSHAYARNERFDSMKGEAVLRDIYKGRYGETMNQTRETLLKAEDRATDPECLRKILNAAESIAPLIARGDTCPFYQAFDTAAIVVADELKISQAGAKRLMKEAYHAAHNRDLYEVGKAAEQLHHKPVRDAEIAARKAEQTQTRSQSQTRH